MSHSLLGSSLFPFSAPGPSLPLLCGVIRNGSLWEAGQKGGNFLVHYQLTRLQMVQLECPRVRHPLMSSTYKVFVAAYISFVSERRLASRRAGGLCENTYSTLYSHQMNGRFREITHITSCPYAMFHIDLLLTTLPGRMNAVLCG